MPHEATKKKRSSLHARHSLGREQPKRQEEQIQPSTIKLDKRDEYHQFLRSLVASHIDSFSFAVGDGLMLLSEELEPAIVRGPENSLGESTLVSVRLQELSIRKPRFNVSSSGSSSGIMRNLLPMQCRLAGSNYLGDLFAAINISFNNVEVYRMPVQRIARIPIMVGSAACHLHNLPRDELLKLGEEEYEFGGIFIINGGERLLRNTLIPRPNHAISAVRDKNAARGPLFSNLSLSFRSMKQDLSMVTNHFHFLKSGAVRVRVMINRKEFFIPAGVLLRALLPSCTTDREIFDLIVGGETDDMDLRNSAIAIVKELHERYIHFKRVNAEPGVRPTVSRRAAISYLGKNFRLIIGLDDESISDLDAGTAFLRRFILVHLSLGSYSPPDENYDRAKAELIIYLVRKLVATSTGKIEVDNADAISHQGVMTGGHLYLLCLKERLSMFLRLIGMYMSQEKSKKTGVDRSSGNNLISLAKDCINKAVKTDMISKGMRNLISTGNIPPKAIIDLPQTTGYSIVAERINFFRYLSHFRAVHRGAFYSSMRSTKVRKLLPEAWGFICPVHTPDGDPCGILNHLAADAFVTIGESTNRDEMVFFMTDMNVMPAPSLSSICTKTLKGTMPIFVDGRIMGYVHPQNAQVVVDQLRYSKVRSSLEAFSSFNEIALVMPIEEKGGFMPGIYIHTCAARLMRPVKWLKARRGASSTQNTTEGIDEFIGTLEQVFMKIRPAVDYGDSMSAVDPKGATHEEKSNVSFLSVLAQLSPFPDMNQGPRNMFQCQMAKQTMGTPCHAIWNRMDSKTYQHCTPQVPIARNECMQDVMGADLFPNGVNAVVAVISYSGNDMEDALILNKASIERGFARGSIYVNSRVNLDERRSGRETVFARVKNSSSENIAVDEDGLPKVGAQVQHGTNLYGQCSKHNKGDKGAFWVKHKSVEDGVVDNVVVYDSEVYNNNPKTGQGEGIREANVRIRIPRVPTVGDKFASRAGQKGTMSAAWPSQDMPFSESGMMPDILFNPNGFPSRMTIGMMVEIMSGKSGALHGMFNDSTPFKFDENERAIDYFAEQLVKAGYQHSGNETLYSGYTGEPLQVEIFTGIVHYQRLRHMVSDKFQVRTTGSVNPLYRQPIKGRKKGGAIRFGEMERDGLLAHGASFLLRDRLALASDLHILHVCEKCGSLLSPVREKTINEIVCKVCDTDADQRKGCVRKVALPYSFKYLVNELAAMNIRTVLKLKEVV